MREVIARSDSGFVAVETKEGERRTWNDAEEGDEHAVWVVAQLEADSIEMIISSSGSTAAR